MKKTDSKRVLIQTHLLIHFFFDSVIQMFNDLKNLTDSRVKYLIYSKV